MPARRSSMHRVHVVLRLWRTTDLSQRQIAESAYLAPSTVAEYVKRIDAAEVPWPLPKHVDDAELERLLFASTIDRSPERSLPDWSEIHRDRQSTGKTLRVLWQVYSASHPAGLGYSRFCELYNLWRGSHDDRRQEAAGRSSAKR